MACEDVRDGAIQPRLVIGGGPRVAHGGGILISALALLEQRQGRQTGRLARVAGVVVGPLGVQPGEAGIDGPAHVLAESRDLGLGSRTREQQARQQHERSLHRFILHMAS